VITVILNAYKRLEYLETQIQSINNQSVKVNEIIVWQNGSLETKVPKLNSNIKHIYSNFNFGVWSRFSAALNSKSEFICVFDDDTIPGKNWLKNCLETIKKKNGLLGSRGVRFASKKKYLVGEEFGWSNPKNEIKEVDIVGHSWFFRREWLSYFWKELPNFNEYTFVGEDIHFSYVLQKYLGLKTYVPPHPIDDETMWGSNKNLAIDIGTDKSAISYNEQRINEMNQCFLNYIEKGFHINFTDKLKIKGIFLQNKIKFSKHLKNLIKKNEK
tara:strand:+ start:505 stop:1317 length:813 start_codon:yes stop_codon:yes gene_type:complete